MRFRLIQRRFSSSIKGIKPSAKSPLAEKTTLALHFIPPMMFPLRPLSSVWRIQDRAAVLRGGFAAKDFGKRNQKTLPLLLFSTRLVHNAFAESPGFDVFLLDTSYDHRLS
jgi:hypothetical protein